MAYSPVITKTAEHTYTELIEFINKTYGEKPTQNLIKNISTIINYISINPLTFPVSQVHWQYHRALVDTYTSIYYSIKEVEKEIVIHCFWHNKRDPKYLEKFL